MIGPFQGKAKQQFWGPFAHLLLRYTIQSNPMNCQPKYFKRDIYHRIKTFIIIIIGN